MLKKKSKARVYRTIVNDCEECPNLQLHTRDREVYALCGKNGKEIKNTSEIPEECPLELWRQYE